jgi:crotonobetainyl-CoA:carnitine CoA-transferase CaiB-like acyl-CoA transferase
MSGIMSVTGAPENAPYRVGYPVADTIGGITAAFAVAAALADHDRAEGVFIDVSMLEAAMATMGWAVSNHLIAGLAPQPLGNDNVTASPSGTFRTGDGLLNIAANKQEQFEAVCEVLGHPEWAQDPRFVDRHARLQHREALRGLMEQAMAAQPADAWWRLLNEAGVPAGPVYSVPQALAHPQIAERGMIGTFENAPGVGRDIRIVRTGFKLNGEAPSVETPPPLLGQHNDEILTELGCSQSEIAALKEEKVV